MKFSDLSTDRALDALVICTGSITNILKDEKLLDSIKTKLKREDIKSAAELINLGAEKINTIVPLLLGAHRKDICSIIAAVNGQTVEDVLSQNVMKTVNEARELLEDEEFISFFGSVAGMGKSA